MGRVRASHRLRGAPQRLARLRHARRSRSGNCDRGSVTAELAVLLPGVVLAIVVILVVASAGVMQVRCADAARAGARAAALGEDEAQVAAIVRQLAGDNAQVSLTRSEDWVDVRVTGEVPLGQLSGVLHTDVVFSALPEPTGTAPDGEDG